MTRMREATTVGALIVVGVLLALGLVLEPAHATVTITPILGTPVCDGPACLDEITNIPLIMREEQK